MSPFDELFPHVGLPRSAPSGVDSHSIEQQRTTLKLGISNHTRYTIYHNGVQKPVSQMKELATATRNLYWINHKHSFQQIFGHLAFIKQNGNWIVVLLDKGQVAENLLERVFVVYSVSLLTSGGQQWFLYWFCRKFLG
jgi:hypothetical protein